jgi:hypothetical protein
MKLQLKHWKRLSLQLVLEVLMFVAPVNLDYLGVVGEYLVDCHREQAEFVA